MRPTLIITAGFFLVAGCALPPDIEAALGPEPPGTAYPELLPISELIDQGSYDTEAEAAAAEAFEQRVAALKTKSKALKQSTP